MSTDYLSYLSNSQQNRMHMAGAASGIDINSLIDAEMTKAAEPVTKLQEQEQTLTNRQTALQLVADKLDAFRSFVNEWKLQSNFFHNNATSSDENVLTVSTSGSIRDTSFNVTVDNLSKSQAYYSTSSVSAENTTKLENLGGTGNGISGSGTLSINVNGESYSVDYYEGNTLEEITDQIESLDDNLQVYAVNSSDGLKIFFSGVDAGVNLQISDSGTLLESLNMTESFKSSGFVLGDPEAAMEEMGIDSGQLKITVDGTEYTVDYDAATDDFDQWIDDIYSDPAYEGLLEKVSIYYGSNGQTGDSEAMKLFINAKNPESELTIEESGAGNMLEMMRFFETYASSERVSGVSTDNLDTFGMTTDAALTFTIGGTDYDIAYDVDAESLNDIAAKINADVNINGTVLASVVDTGAGTVQLVLSGKDATAEFELSDSGELLRTFNLTEEFESTSTVSGASADTLESLGVTGDSGRISVNIDGNYRYINYDASAGGDTLDDVVAKINAADSRLYASVVDSGGNLTLQIGSTDPSVDIALSDSGDFLDVFNIDTDEASGHHSNGHTDSGYTDSGFQVAEQATATVDFGGISTEITSDTNTFSNVLQGISFTARQESATPITVTVTQDIESTKDHINEFVDEYNALMDYIYVRLFDEDDQVQTTSSVSDSTSDTDLEQTLKDYLSDEEDLSEVLIGDPTLRDIFNELKGLAYQDFDNGGLELYYSNSLTGSSSSLLSDLGVSLPSGSDGTLTIHVDGFDDPITVEYSETDTVQDIIDRLNQYSDYNVTATVEENDSGSFVFKISSPKDIIVTDSTTTTYSGLKNILLTNHYDTSLKYDFLTDIGLGASDGFNGYEDAYRNVQRGRIIVNDDLLEEALMNDSESVWELFGISETIAGIEVDGFATKLTDKIYEYNKFNTGKLQRVIGYSGTINEEIRRINSEIVNWSSKLNTKFEALWKKYAAMEQSISSLQEQGNALQQAFTNMNGGS
ncbi:MAG TPA: flagellar filament capping protein FliD [Thermotogota bacterium]|mgnify:CR=1 FL=1|nr:flagellar filament capping protein FliD [Thermotogota bacterium]HPR95935.1 flagellar filament capping protein FliD [Thermotogota bacterium]